MASRLGPMIRCVADRVPPVRMAFWDRWTAIRPVRTIVRDGWMTFRDADRVPGRVPAAGMAPGRASR
jgi:hypothetical protein